MFNKTTNEATALVEKFKTKKVKVKSEMTKKSLLKSIGSILADYKSLTKEKKNDLTYFYEYLYDYFRTRFGLKNVAERNFL